MNLAVEENITAESVNFLNSCYIAGGNDKNISEDFTNVQYEKKISSITDKYINITGSDLEETELSGYKNELKNSVAEFFDRGELKIANAETVENFTKIAFRRLSKASKEFYMEKIHNPESKKLGLLQKMVKKLKQDYDLLMSIN